MTCKNCYKVCWFSKRGDSLAEEYSAINNSSFNDILTVSGGGTYIQHADRIVVLPRCCPNCSYGIRSIQDRINDFMWDDII